MNIKEFGGRLCMGIERGRCLVDFELEELIKSGRVKGSSFGVQPNSLDVKLGDEGFALSTDEVGIFQPQEGKTVAEIVAGLPTSRVDRLSLSQGAELKVGHTYLFPLDASVNLLDGERVKSSTKSTFGRLFVNARMMADYNPCFDEVHHVYSGGRDASLWLLVQPLVFNLVAYPGVAINQTRFFTGEDYAYSMSEIRELSEREALLLDAKGSRARHIISDGVQIHLDLQGPCVGLRAIQNHTPISLISHNGNYNVEKYFERIETKAGTVMVRPSQHYLFATKESLSIPADVSCELSAHSHKGVQGPLHFAGFIDSGFKGDLVFEIRPEITQKELYDGMPLGDLLFFRNNAPKQLYGGASNYQAQRGPKPAKYFGWK